MNVSFKNWFSVILMCYYCFCYYDYIVILLVFVLQLGLKTRIQDVTIMFLVKKNGEFNETRVFFHYLMVLLLPAASRAFLHSWQVFLHVGSRSRLLYFA